MMLSKVFVSDILGNDAVAEMLQGWVFNQSQESTFIFWQL